MTNNDKQNRIYIRSAKQWVPCTKEQFDDYYRDINAYRRTQQNHGRCVCPPSKRLMCDMDCWTCPYCTQGDLSSLDSGHTDNESTEMNWLDQLQREMPDLQVPSSEDLVTDVLYMRQLLARVCELLPQAIEIWRLRQLGVSDDAIATKIGTGRKTFAYRIKKTAEVLKKEFPDFF
ncbi:hypothetical protein [Agathobaculum massiliense]|uniref:hypothetical protein n=1 Tax=Agathobaculum massiliense TaxID=3014267 RepID=UPI000D1DB5A5|nr:hypothetical protein [Agathobaculum massiliense]